MMTLPIYVINLDRSTDRQRFMARQMASLGLSFSFIAAVDGRALDLGDPSVVTKSAVADGRLAQGNAVAGAVGCSLSHSKAYEAILQTRATAAVILEDDASLPLDSAILLHALAQSMPAEVPSVVLLSFSALGAGHKGLRVSSTGIELPGQRELFEIKDVVRARLTTAYFITRSACQLMLPLTRPVSAAADDWHYFVQQGALHKLYCVSPMPAWPAQRFRSTMDVFQPGSLQATFRTLANATPVIGHALSLRRAGAQRRILGITGKVQVVPCREQ